MPPQGPPPRGERYASRPRPASAALLSTNQASRAGSATAHDWQTCAPAPPVNVVPSASVGQDTPTPRPPPLPEAPSAPPLGSHWGPPAHLASRRGPLISPAIPVSRPLPSRRVQAGAVVPPLRPPPLVGRARAGADRGPAGRPLAAARRAGRVVVAVGLTGSVTRRRAHRVTASTGDLHTRRGRRGACLFPSTKPVWVGGGGGGGGGGRRRARCASPLSPPPPRTTTSRVAQNLELPHANPLSRPRASDTRAKPGWLPPRGPRPTPLFSTVGL